MAGSTLCPESSAHDDRPAEILLAGDWDGTVTTAARLCHIEQHSEQLTPSAWLKVASLAVDDTDLMPRQSIKQVYCERSNKLAEAAGRANLRSSAKGNALLALQAAWQSTLFADASSVALMQCDRPNGSFDSSAGSQ